MDALPQRVTPGPLFFRGLGYGFLGSGLLWLALAVLVYLLA